MHGGLMKVDTSTSDLDMAMTSETNSQSEGSEPTAINTMSQTGGGGAVEIELIVSIDSDCEGTNTPQVLTRGKHDEHSPNASPRQGSLPDMMRLLPPIRDHDSDSAVHQQGLTVGAGSLSLRSTRSNSPLLVLDRSGGPGLCFRASDSEKMLPVLLPADAGLHPRSHGLLGNGSQGGSLSALSRPLSPRHLSSSFPHHPLKDKPAGITHHLHRRLSEDKHRLPQTSEPLGRTVDMLNETTDAHPTMLRRRSCQSPNRITFKERRRASEGVLAVSPSQLGQYSQTKTPIELRSPQSKTSPSTRGHREIGELMSTVPGRKAKGQKTPRGPGLNRMSRLSSASLEAVNKRGDPDENDSEQQRILQWLEGVRRGSDGLTDNVDLGVGQFEPLSRSSTETAIRVIHKDRN
ncbi:uncharacterized protein LOC110975381 [Acanthaster planci]|uniref:Uncharacterized protein LOC110975381 n=1 Tax=Acanthaster planci TaxID=133434 RepID=A0A8B7XUD3_ACAPL|nr:uncharacterized protein LOC110975381 [Acanthaster planci]